MNIPVVAVSIVAQWISNADLSSIESVSATVLPVGYFDVVDSVGRLEVHSPPGSIILFCVRCGQLVPVACTAPINSLLRPTIIMCGWLCGNSSSCPICPLKEAWKPAISLNIINYVYMLSLSHCYVSSKRSKDLEEEKNCVHLLLSAVSIQRLHLLYVPNTEEKKNYNESPNSYPYPAKFVLEIIIIKGTAP